MFQKIRIYVNLEHIPWHTDYQGFPGNWHVCQSISPTPLQTYKEFFINQASFLTVEYKFTQHCTICFPLRTVTTIFNLVLLVMALKGWPAKLSYKMAPPNSLRSAFFQVQRTRGPS